MSAKSHRCGNGTEAQVSGNAHTANSAKQPGRHLARRGQEDAGCDKLNTLRWQSAHTAKRRNAAPRKQSSGIDGGDDANDGTACSETEQQEQTCENKEHMRYWDERWM